MMIPLCLLPVLVASSPQTLDLDGAWRLHQDARKIDISAKVPGAVQTDLMRAGIIPDPYLGTNEKTVQWVSDLPWSYSRDFDVSPAFLANRRIVLRCEGIDTFGTIRINGQEVAKPDNFYRTWEFDAKPFLRPGRNTIQIDFETLASFLKRNEDRPKGFGKPVQEGGKPYIRKPAFQGGWDFSPKLLTMGIWRHIGLVGWDTARLTDMGIAQDHTKSGQVGLNVRLTADVAGPTTAHTTVLFKGRKVDEATTSLVGSDGTARLTVQNPQLWWPNEMGPQNLYDVRVELLDSRGHVLDRGSRRIGLRTVKWISKTKENPLGLVVNGRRFFAKGSNWVPYDSLLRENTAGERALVQKAVDAHMNLMRLWGGGYYVNDAFLDACDEKGLLAWFEFGYADSPYPSFDPQWLAGAKAEAEDNVRRVRHHPSLAVFSGNNEVIDREADQTSSGNMNHEEYTLLFRKTLRDVVQSLAPDVPYTPGSPEIGDNHYWTVWHGAEWFDAYLRLHGFMSEYGFQAIPVPQTTEAFTTPEQRASFGTEAMLNHQKNWRDAYALMISTMRRAYRKPKDFDSTIWLSQIQQAQGILTGVEHWRRDWPNSTASLVWQYNDPWPGTSWSMMDYYRRPKALYYNLKHAYAPVALSSVVDSSGQVGLWVANDRVGAKHGHIDWTLTKLDGTKVDSGAADVNIPGGTSSTQVVSKDLKATIDREGATNLLLWANLKVAGEPDSTTTLLFAKPKELNLVDPGLKAAVARYGPGYRVTVSSEHPALWSWIELKGIDAELSDNFLNVRPGAPATIDVVPRGKSSLEQVKAALAVRSLYDTYLPGTEANPTVKAEPRGKIVATAEDVEIRGEGPILEVGTPSNIGNWRSTNNSLVWTVTGAKAGTYEVTALISCPPSDAGGTYEVEVEGQKLVATVKATRSWTDYETVTLGTVRIAQDGATTITMRPLTKPHDNLMNVRSVILTPTR